MKLLILTQKIDINDDVLGFMYGWVKEFAKQCESVTVICLKKGEYELPKNVKVLSLGKEEHKSRIKYLLNLWKFVYQERKSYNNVFVHMNHKYVIYCWLIWKFLNKKIGLWYAHGYAPVSLKFAVWMSDIIFTSTKSGFRLESDKVKVVGQGIKVAKYSYIRWKPDGRKLKIITIGRISPVKDYETLIRAVELLVKDGLDLEVKIIGRAGLPEQEEYLEKLKKILEEKKLRQIEFVGSVPNKDITTFLKDADLFVNMSHTGSLDKAMLEAMASGVILLTCNEALEELLYNHKEILIGYKDKLLYEKGNYGELADKIKMIKKMSSHDKADISEKLQRVVIMDHNLNNFVKKIISLF